MLISVRRVSEKRGERLKDVFTCDISTAVITIPTGPARSKQHQRGLIISQMAMSACYLVRPFGFSHKTRPTDINIALLNQTKKA